MKKKGILQLAGIVVAIGILGFIAFIGFGSNQYGSIYDVKLGLDLAGGVSITYQAVKEDPTTEEMDDAKLKLRLRAEEKSTESAVYIEGTNRINVDIPHVTDANAILEDMGRVGSIYFIYAEGSDGVENIAYNSEIGKYELTRSMDDIIADGLVVLDGSDIADAQPYINKADVTTQYLVKLTLTEQGATKFEAATADVSQYYSSSSVNLKNILAIVYDGEVIVAPTVKTTITGTSAVIEGQESYDDASELSSTIRIGALPLELEEIRSQIVGAKLGSEAIQTSLLAGLIGFILVIIFLIINYRIPGVAASIALIFYVCMIIVTLNIFNVTLTLPGIAGIILSIGMAVDANVIIFNRIYEEIESGKTIRSSMKIGFQKSMSAILDGNITTLIAAIVLYFLGSGTVKGFAITLGIGIVLSMFTALVVTKAILTSLFNLGLKGDKSFGKARRSKLRNYVKNGKVCVIISATLILIGIGAMIYNKATIGTIFNYNLDFVGGTSTEVTFNDAMPDDIQLQLETGVNSITGLTAEVSLVESTNSAIIKTMNLTQEQRAEISDYLVSTFGVDPGLITTENISATVSSDMRRDAMLAVGIATICMLFYIWVRFKNLTFAASAVLALLHDVLIVLAVYALASRHIAVGSTFIACMLTIVGYSINATIVIFDRIRENMSLKLKKDSIADIVNSSITSTMNRSIDTSLTTLFTVVALVIFGMDSVREFAIPLMIGIISGGYSSALLTGPVWHFFQKKKKAKEA